MAEGEPTPDKPAGAILTVILITALALRLPVMFESLWFDEYYMSSHTIGSLALLLKSLYSDIHPPAYYSFMAVWIQCFGDSEFSLRLPPLLCGLGTIALVFAIGRHFISQATGLVAAAILALAPVHIWYSTEARPYSAQLFLLLLTVLAFARLQSTTTGPTRKWQWTYGIALFLLVFTHYYMAAYAVAFSVLAIACKLPDRRIVSTVNAVTLLLMAAYVGFKVLTNEFETERGYLRAFTPGEWWAVFFDWFLCGNTLTPSEGAYEFAGAREVLLHVFQALAALLFALGIHRIVKEREAPAWQLLAHLAWLPLFLLALTMIGRDKTYIERSILPAYPFFALTVAAGLTRCRPRGLIVGTFVALQAATTTAFYFERDIRTIYRPNPDWRGAATYLGEEIDAHAQELRIYTPYWSPDVLSFYEPRIQQAKTFENSEASMGRLLGAIEKHLGKDGFLGGIAYSFAESMNDEFQATLKAKQDGMRMPIYQMSRQDPRRAPRDRPFYVVYPGDPKGYLHPGTVALIDEPDVEEVELRTWRWLRVHKLRFVD